MGKCAFCGANVAIPFKCTFCGRTFCIAHRLPENHKCQEAPVRVPLGSWKTKRRHLLRTSTQPKATPPKATSSTGVHCTRCGSRRVQTTAYKKKKVQYECLDCGEKWTLYYGSRPTRRSRSFRLPLRQLFCVIGALLVGFAYLRGIDWLSLNQIGHPILGYVLMAFVLAMPHEVMHALAWWSYGYFAIPIPLCLPIIWGITIGPKPSSFLQNAVISLAPIWLTCVSFLPYYLYGDTHYTTFGLLNLSGMFYDVISVFRG